ncbi:MAG: MATE family efflux transporter [Eubacteriales bacterium]|nr:MATE family efflux transporter [Eubacteriales bacterium]
MTKGNPVPLMLRFMLPLLLGNIFQQLYNMADTIIVGRFVGSGALAAVGSTGTIMFLINGFAQGITSGFSVLTAQYFGAGDKEGMKRSVGNGMTLAFLITAVMTLLCVLLMKPLLTLMHTPADIFEDAYTYISLISYGLFATVLYNLTSAFLRAIGNSRVPLYTLLFSAALNVALDLVLIINVGMGVAGAAVATVISQFLSGVICFVYIRKNEPLLRAARRDFRLNKRDTKRQLAIGVPMALQFSITACGTMIMQTAINYFGSTAIAAYTAACKLQNILQQGMVAMGQMSATYAGQNAGKQDFGRIREGVRASLKIDTVYSLAAAFIMVMILPNGIRAFFSGDISELLPYARIYINISVVFYIPLSFIFIFRNFMQGAGYSLMPMLGGVVEMFARLIFAFLAIYTHSFVLACFCDPAAWLFAAVFLAVAYRGVARKMQVAWGYPLH